MYINLREQCRFRSFFLPGFLFGCVFTLSFLCANVSAESKVSEPEKSQKQIGILHSAEEDQSHRADQLDNSPSSNENIPPHSKSRAQSGNKRDIGPKLNSRGTSVLSAVLPMFAALAAILLIIFSLAWLLKRINPGGFNQSAIRIRESQSLGMKSRLLLVEVEGERILLGVTPHSVQKVHQLSSNSIPNKSGYSASTQLQKNTSTDSSANFSQLMKKVLGLNSTAIIEANTQPESSVKVEKEKDL